MEKSLFPGELFIGLWGPDPTVKEAPGARPAPPFAGHVTLEGVHFAYEDEAGEGLRGMGFDVQAGSRVAPVGVSGGRKTTGTSPTPRPYDPRRARVLVEREGKRGFSPQ